MRNPEPNSSDKISRSRLSQTLRIFPTSDDNNTVGKWCGRVARVKPVSPAADPGVCCIKRPGHLV